MKTMFKVLAATLVLSGTTLAHARDINVGVSIAGEFQPGVYGQVNVDTMPSYSVYSQPVYTQPVYSQRVYSQPVVIVRQPAYYAAPVRPVYVVQPYRQDYRHCYHDRGHNHGHHHRHH